MLKRNRVFFNTCTLCLAHAIHKPEIKNSRRVFDMEKIPRVSVVIPTFRRPELVGRALKSVIDQTYTDFEVMVVDDNSTGRSEQPATAKLIKGFDDPRVHYIINQESMGAAEARNIGIRKAKGEYIAFLDDDEDWIKEKLSRQVPVLDAAAGDVCVIDTGFFDWGKKGRPRVVLPKMEGWILERLLRKTAGRAPKLSTMLCRKSALFEVGLFDKKLRAREDYDLYIRLARLYRFLSVKEPLANKRSDAGQRIGSNPENYAQGYEVVYRKILQDLESNPRNHSVYLLKFAAVLSSSDRHQEALEKYMQAFRLWAWNPRLITYGLKLLRH